MKTHKELLNVVDKNDNVIGRETRYNIHKKGLLHREVWIFIYNKDLDILFQKRSRNKDTFPNKLDVSVGGHVDLGYNYDDTALKELKEETGIAAKKEDLIYLEKIRSKKHSPTTKNTNNVFRKIFAYKFTGNIKALRLEKDITKFEFWPIEKLFRLSQSEKSKFVPLDWEEKIFPILKKLKKLAKR